MDLKPRSVREQKGRVDMLCVTVSSQMVCPWRKRLTTLLWTLSSNRQVLARPLRMGPRPQHLTNIKQGPSSAWLQGKMPPFLALTELFPLIFLVWASQQL